MESFRWNKNFFTGLPEIDAQHRHLVNIINDFGELLTRNELESRNIETIFEELARYAQYHFQSEEALMSAMSPMRKIMKPSVSKTPATITDWTCPRPSPMKKK